MYKAHKPKINPKTDPISGGPTQQNLTMSSTLTVSVNEMKKDNLKLRINELTGIPLSDQKLWYLHLSQFGSMIGYLQQEIRWID